MWIATQGEHIAILTAPGSREARNLPHDPFMPVILRGRVVHWIEGEAGWQIVDRIARKYTGVPYPREQERVVSLIEAHRQRVGISAG